MQLNRLIYSKCVGRVKRPIKQTGVVIMPNLPNLTKRVNGIQLVVRSKAEWEYVRVVRSANIDRMSRICLFTVIFLATLYCGSSRKCGTLEIRNSAADLERKLRNCTLAVSVKILLLERQTENDFKNISFPELLEVLDFIVLYRVNGLSSLGQLFPNLVSIRGKMPFLDYTLVLYDLPNLKEVNIYVNIEIDRFIIICGYNVLVNISISRLVITCL